MYLLYTYTYNIQFKLNDARDITFLASAAKPYGTNEPNIMPNFNPAGVQLSWKCAAYMGREKCITEH